LFAGLLSLPELLLPELSRLELEEREAFDGRLLTSDGFLPEDVLVSGCLPAFDGLSSGEAPGLLGVDVPGLDGLFG
jgi:hypothetical protein